MYDVLSHDFSVLSDHHICGGGDSSPHPHLPAHQNPHRHRPHPGVQQVSHNVVQCNTDREADVRGHAQFVWNWMSVSSNWLTWPRELALTSCVFYTELSVTWCPLCSTLWSPLFSCWCVLPTGAPLLCILPFDPRMSAYCTLCRVRFHSVLISTVQDVVLPKHTFVDTWPLQETPSTESWLWIPKATVRVSTAQRPATPRWKVRHDETYCSLVCRSWFSHGEMAIPEWIAFVLQTSTQCFFFPPLRTLTPQIIQAATPPAVSSSNTTKRVSSRGICSTCRSTMLWLSSGVSTSSSLWGSAPLRGPSPPTTGPSPNQMTSPCSPFVPASYAHSGRLLQIIFATIDFTIKNCLIPAAKRNRSVADCSSPSGS